MFSVTTGRDSVVPGLNPISARMGPTGERYLNPNPGVMAVLFLARVGFVLWLTIPASTNTAPISCCHTGNRASTLPSTTKFPPSGRGSKSRSLRAPALGLQVVTAVPDLHATFNESCD